MPKPNDLPLFDPAWDYATIYDRINSATNDAIALLNYMASVEDATRESDLLLIASVTAIARKFNSVSELIKPSQDI